MKATFCMIFCKAGNFIYITLPVALAGKLHAAAGPPGRPSGSDEERPEEEGHRLSLGAAGARGLHLTGQRDMRVHLWETPPVPVQSE